MGKTKDKLVNRETNKVDKTALKKIAAVEAWRETRGHITNTCRVAEVGRTTYYEWLKDDENFAQAIEDAEAELNDDVREVLVHKAGDGDMTATIFYLKSRHPDFNPKPRTFGVRSDGEQIEVVIKDYE